MITRNKLLSMLQLQAALNQKIHPQWYAQRFKWTRAIMVEAVEALDHYGWKWWKKQEPDLVQVRIELVDIWHFMLSHELERFDGNADAAADTLFAFIEPGAPDYLVEGDTLKTFDLLIASAAVGQIHWHAFMALLHQCGLGWGDLYSTFVAKNVLNTFRQDHGYKEGTYVKEWAGAEDNVALGLLMELNPDATPEQLRSKLDQLYALVLADMGKTS